MLKKVNMSGQIFWNNIEDLSKSVGLDRRQIKWMSLFSKDIIEIIDEANCQDRTWQDAFREIKDICNCDFYACCSQQLIKFIKMGGLLGALYFVKMENLSGSSLRKTMIQDTLTINLPQLGGSRNNFNLYNKAFDSMINKKRRHQP